MAHKERKRPLSSLFVGNPGVLAVLAAISGVTNNKYGQLKGCFSPLQSTTGRQDLGGNFAAIVKHSEASPVSVIREILILDGR